MPSSILATTLLFLVLCCTMDVRTRRIPNWLTGMVMIIGIGLSSMYFGVPGLKASLAGLSFSMAVLLPPFALGGIGGGDVKMMGAVGALLGPRLALAGLALGVVVGGVIMVLHLARRGILRQKLVATWTMFAAATTTGSVSPLKVSPHGPDAVTLPYSIPLGLGTAIVLALRTLSGT